MFGQSLGKAAWFKRRAAKRSELCRRNRSLIASCSAYSAAGTWRLSLPDYERSSGTSDLLRNKRTHRPEARGEKAHEFLIKISSLDGHSVLRKLAVRPEQVLNWLAIDLSEKLFGHFSRNQDAGHECINPRRSSRAGNNVQHRIFRHEHDAFASGILVLQKGNSRFEARCRA